MKRPGDCKIERKVRIVLSQVVAPAVDAAHEASFGIGYAARRAAGVHDELVGDRLCRVSLHPYVTRETARQFRVGIEVESVSLITVRRGIFSREIIEISIAEAERIPLIRVIIIVARIRVIRFHLELLGEMLSYAKRHSAIERSCITRCLGDTPKVGKGMRVRIRVTDRITT